ncbi:MAG: 2-(1,2-epoxy-1,2-dihydrophenyl)acetyl-CoA isomerase [Firmicutes bacterium]|nr:2-(1,2-epoxy-1,2-dihydrophenyl)acetyl-CoA isomerase [Bacillota bacterium]
MEWETVLLETRGNVGVITMNRPQQLNAINFTLGEDLVAALEECRREDRIRSIILKGAGKAFCSGGDLMMARECIDTDPPDPYRQLTKRYNRVISDIRRLEKPVIAAINGAVGGGGCSLVMACDLKIASRTAKFRQAYTSSGLVPDGGWFLFTPLLTGFSKTNELLYLDPVIDAEQALAMGLINLVVEPDQLDAAAFEWAERTAAGPSAAYAISKGLINESMLLMLERQLELERQGIIKAAGTEDYREGLNAFFEKRRPSFSGS